MGLFYKYKLHKYFITRNHNLDRFHKLYNIYCEIQKNLREENISDKKFVIVFVGVRIRTSGIGLVSVRLTNSAVPVFVFKNPALLSSGD